MTAKLILNANDNITCPHCNSEFLLKDAVAKHLIEQHEGEYQQLINNELAELKQQAEKAAGKSAAKEFRQEIDALQDKLAQSQENSKALTERIKSERLKAEQSVRETFKLEQQALEESLKLKEQQLDQFRSQELELRRAKTELEDKQKNIELELSRRIEREKDALRNAISDKR